MFTRTDNLNHLKSLDFLRGIASLSVCLYHNSYFAALFIATSSFPVQHNIFKNFLDFGDHGVQVFFVISGLVIPYSLEKGNYTIKKIKTFVYKRLIRIEPPYLISIVFTLILTYFIARQKHEPFQIDYKGLLYHLGYLNAFFKKPWINGVYWTLAIEFHFYALMALLFPLISSKKNYQWILTLLILNLLVLIIPYQDVIFSHFLYFTIGILSYRYIVNKLSLRIFFTMIALCLCFMLIRGLWKDIFVMIFTLAFVFLSFANRVTEFLGNISYSLYLTHGPLGILLFLLFMQMVSSYGKALLLIAFVLAVQIITATLFYYFIENPFKKQAQKLKYI